MVAPNIWDLYKAIYTELVASQPSFDALVQNSGGACTIADHPDQDGTFPFITVGQFTANEDDDKSSDGLIGILDIHAWSRQRGRQEIHQIMDLCRTLLHHNSSITIAGDSVTLIQHLLTIPPTLDPDGHTYHGVVRFSISYHTEI